MTTAGDALGLVGHRVEQLQFDACVDAGGFALVYRGRHLGLGEQVAIKCLRVAQLAGFTDELRQTIASRFRDEAKILYRLSQGNLDIVRCLGASELIAPATGEPVPFTILEWLEGKSLATDLRQRRELGLQPRPLETAVRLLDSAAGALAYAHSQGVVHRDVKPANLFLAEVLGGPPRVRLLDFGFAKVLAHDVLGAGPVATVSGVQFGSPSYAAPEQLSLDGQSGAIGPWTDVYSLALVLLELMVGQRVRPAGSAIDGALKAADPATGSPRASALGLELGREVEDVLASAVAQNPRDRPRDVAAFWTALRDAMSKSEARREPIAMTQNKTLAMASAPVRFAPGAPGAPAAPLHPPPIPPELAPTRIAPVLGPRAPAARFPPPPPPMIPSFPPPAVPQKRGPSPILLAIAVVLATLVAAAIAALVMLRR